MSRLRFAPLDMTGWIGGTGEGLNGGEAAIQSLSPLKKICRRHVERSEAESRHPLSTVNKPCGKSLINSD
jgi:hypothetical protein